MLGCAYIWLWLGLGNLQDAPIPRPGVVYLALDPAVRAGLWIVPAVIALCTAWSRRASTAGLVALCIPSLIVIGSFGWSWALWLVDGGAVGYQYAYFNAAIYGSTLGMVAYVAYQPSPPAMIVRVSE